MKCEKCFKKYKNETTFKRHKCKQKICTQCNTVFKSQGGFKKHLQKREDISCDHCERKFCNNYHFKRHQRSIKKPEEEEPLPDLNQEIYSSSGYEDDEYKKVLEENIKLIEDREDKRKVYTIYNKQIDPTFTYNDLYQLYLDIFITQKPPFRTNLGFGYILHNPKSGEYKYYYVSDNNLIFERMPNIVRRKDINKLMKRIISADLPTTYFLKRPTSQWTLAALTNVEIKVIGY